MLRLHPKIIGEPDWRQLTPGEPTTTVTQWWNPVQKTWLNVPWFSKDGFATRLENNYRVPVSRRAKWEAFWAAAPKWIRVKILRRPLK